jgi:acetyl esterase/lipase
MATEKATSYDPKATFEVRIEDVEYLSVNGQGYLARVYQPVGTGPFPALVDIHGGAWSGSSRLTNEVTALPMAQTGLVVMSIDFRIAPEHPYPAQVQDANYAIRWLKANASRFNADASKMGVLGRSSGGHTALLLGMRPHDERYAALELADDDDASVAYLLTLWPVLDSHGRYLLAKDAGSEHLVSASEGYFLTEEAMREGNPQEILERGEPAVLPPTLITHGSADTNVPIALVERFVANYEKAGGHVELEVFPDQPHTFAAEPGPLTDQAVALMAAFVGRQVVAS